jgi:hypothetical protein
MSKYLFKKLFQKIYRKQTLIDSCNLKIMFFGYNFFGVYEYFVIRVP